jgi:hypothetical protein
MVEFDFLNPDYSVVWQKRAERLKNLRENPEILLKLKEFYKENPVDFINDWGCTFDPRNAEIGVETVVPFLLFEKQAEFVSWVVDRWRGREDGLAEKSRDMGVSWLCVSIAVWMWLFYDGVVIGFGSRKEEYVDKIGDPKSLFWKAREFIKLLPKEFRPKYDAPHMRVLNQDNGSAIVGESGDNIGRGNRTSVYFKDESAFYEHPDSIDAALSQTSNCKIDISTPNGNGNAFYRKRHSGRIKIFTFHWHDDPRKNQDWYDKQKATLDPVILAQEVDIDYNASTSDAWIQGDLIQAAQNKGPADVDANGPWFVGVDAAHFGDDESVIHFRRGRFNDKQVFAKKLDGHDLAHRVIEELERRTRIGDTQIGAIVIELDGPGVSCYDSLKRSKYKEFVAGIHTGSRLSNDKDYNLRAKIWRAARDYLEEGNCCIDKDGELKSQICSVKYKYQDGLLLMQSKKEYKKEFGKSPDRADAFVLSFGTFGAIKAPQKVTVMPMAGKW